MHIFIGYDSSTSEAYHACRGSLIENASDVTPHGLNHRTLRRDQLFHREWRVDEDGQYWDVEDGRPFSTEFSFSRFCTVTLARQMGLDGWVMFCDSDFIFRDDPAKLLRYADSQPDKALLTVQFDWQPEVGDMKMDGRIQSQYSRKLWSSLMMFNMSHPSNTRLNTGLIDTATGTRLHSFCWLDEDEIGTIPEQWNWIEGVSDPSVVPAAVHFSAGLPTHPGYEKSRYADEWWGYYRRQMLRLGSPDSSEGLQA